MTLKEEFIQLLGSGLPWYRAANKLHVPYYYAERWFFVWEEERKRPSTQKA